MLHLTGRHWVDNLIIPSIMTHQLLRAEREVASAAPMHQTLDAVLFCCCLTLQLCLVPLIANFRDVNASSEDDLLS